MSGTAKETNADTTTSPKPPTTAPPRHRSDRAGATEPERPHHHRRHDRRHDRRAAPADEEKTDRHTRDTHTGEDAPKVTPTAETTPTANSTDTETDHPATV